MTTGRPPSKARRPRAFTLVEVALAVAIVGTVLLAMVALLANAVDAQADTRRDTVAVQLSSRVVAALRTYTTGIDDVVAPQAPRSDPEGPGAGLLDAFLPFDFSRFPEDGGRFVLGFDAQGNLAQPDAGNAYEEGATDAEVAYLVTVRGEPLPGHPGLTDVTIGVEAPADVPAANRDRLSFNVWLAPRPAESTPTPEPAP